MYLLRLLRLKERPRLRVGAVERPAVPMVVAKSAPTFKPPVLGISGIGWEDNREDERLRAAVRETSVMPLPLRGRIPWLARLSSRLSGRCCTPKCGRTHEFSAGQGERTSPTPGGRHSGNAPSASCGSPAAGAASAKRAVKLSRA